MAYRILRNVFAATIVLCCISGMAQQVTEPIIVFHVLDNILHSRAACE